MSEVPFIRSGLSVPTHLLPPPSHATAFRASAAPQRSSTANAVDANRNAVFLIPFPLRRWDGERERQTPALARFDGSIVQMLVGPAHPPDGLTFRSPGRGGAAAPGRTRHRG